uniref:Astacin domain-containing protein n=1 Tax=Parastrongyloides trichosuri TaxID=131310 RepID=A0A0N4ZDZ0_PARTI
MLYKIIIVACLTTILKSSRRKINDDKVDLEELMKDFKKPTIDESSKKINYHMSGLENFETTIVKDILSDFSKVSCLLFNHQTKPFTGPGIVFKKDSHTNVKTNSTDKNTIITLDRDCSASYACIRLLVGYTLGMIPQVNRQDRDKYVIVNKDNIEKKYFKKFKKLSSPLFKGAGEFDFGSFFNREYTYKSIDDIKESYSPKTIHNYYKMLGQRNELSHNDMKILHNFYCGQDKANKDKCKNGGFYNEKVKKCVCPRGFESEDCTKLIQKLSECGNSKIFATDKNETLHYHGKGPCFYQIVSKDSSKKLKLEVRKGDFPNAKPCTPYNGLEIRYTSDKSVTGLTLCGYNNIRVPLPVQSKVVFVGYNGGKDHYFNITYMAV